MPVLPAQAGLGVFGAYFVLKPQGADAANAPRAALSCQGSPINGNFFLVLPCLPLRDASSNSTSELLKHTCIFLLASPKK